MVCCNSYFLWDAGNAFLSSRIQKKYFELCFRFPQKKVPVSGNAECGHPVCVTSVHLDGT